MRGLDVLIAGSTKLKTTLAKCDVRFWKHVVYCLLCAGLADCFEESEVAKAIEQVTYRQLQQRLSTQNYLPQSAVLDIGFTRPAGTGVSDRGILSALLKSVVSARPRAIGIDIDFSPEQKDRFLTPQDATFFDQCRQITDSGIPVFLGIYRTRNLPPDSWLGPPEFSSLAALLALPKKPTHYIRVVGEKRGVTLSTALALSTMSSYNFFSSVTILLPKGFPFIEETSEIDPHSEGVGQRALLNYGFLSNLRKQTYSISAPTIPDCVRLRLKDKIVLMGDVEHASDQFPDPTNPEGKIPGVLVHAAAVCTMLQGRLFTPVGGFNFVADFLLALVGVMAVSILAKRLDEHKNRNSSNAYGSTQLAPDTHSCDAEADAVERRLEILASWIIGGMVLLLGVSVRLTHFFWTGYLVVGIALVLHPWMSSQLDAVQDFGVLLWKKRKRAKEAKKRSSKRG